jgi:hypothetical protein
VASGFVDTNIDPDGNSMPRWSWSECLLGVTGHRIRSNIFWKCHANRVPWSS